MIFAALLTIYLKRFLFQVNWERRAQDPAGLPPWVVRARTPSREIWQSPEHASCPMYVWWLGPSLQTSSSRRGCVYKSGGGASLSDFFAGVVVCSSPCADSASESESEMMICAGLTDSLTSSRLERSFPLDLVLLVILSLIRVVISSMAEEGATRFFSYLTVLAAVLLSQS